MLYWECKITILFGWNRNGQVSEHSVIERFLDFKTLFKRFKQRIPYISHRAGLAVCTKGENKVGGSAQRECCDCCKLGERAAVKAENCAETVFRDNELCTHAFQKCCNDRKEKLPTRE